MELYTALIIPGFLTVIVTVLSWIYMRNDNRLTSNSIANDITNDDNPSERNERDHEEKPTRGQDSNITDGNLRAELDAYILNPDDIQEVPEQIPLDDKLIEQEMKEKGMENIQTYYKSSRLHIKELEGTLTRQEKEQEQLAQRKQLEEIYKLMAREKDKFGVDSMDEIEDQMKLYNLQ